MQTINIKPVQIIGVCPIGLGLEDEFQIDGMHLYNPKGSKLCFLAISQIPLGQGIWQLQSEERFFSHVTCPGCTLVADQENRVTFLLGHGDKWELCQLISEYLMLSKLHGETITARLTKEKAIGFQNNGNYQKAANQMKVALGELRRSHP